MFLRFRWIIPCILLSLLVLGSFLRLEGLNRQSYWMDEGYTVNAVLAQVKNGTRHFSSVLDSGQIYSCPLYCHPTSWIERWLGNQPLSYRLLSALIGALFIFIIYKVSLEIFKKPGAALLTSFFITFSYWQIAWSRQARWYTLLEVFFWLAVLFFFRFLRHTNTRSRIIAFGLAILFTLLAIATQGIAYLLPILFLTWHFIEKRPPIKRLLAPLGMTVGFLLIAQFAFHLIFLRQVFAQITFNNHIFYYASFYWRTYWPIWLVIGYGLIRATSDQRRMYLLLLSPFFAYFLSISLFTEIIHYRYLFHTTPALFLIAGNVIMNEIERQKNRWKQLGIIAISLVIFFGTGLGIVFSKAFYTLEADDPATLRRSYYAYTPQPNFNAAYRFVRDHKKADDLIITTQPQFNPVFLGQAGYWLAYSYLDNDRLDPVSTGERERYANAIIIHSEAELEPLIEQRHGYVIIDSMAADGRLPLALIRFIQSHSALDFYDQQNSYSSIWVYRF